jgi:Tfp pilus assembly protein PilX
MKTKGFTLLYASLVVSLILSVALAIAHIMLTEITLSSAGKDSQKAFYAADTGLECALYYENNVPAADDFRFFRYRGGPGNSFVGGLASEISGTIECGERSPTGVNINNGNANASTTTTFDIETSSGICFNIFVEKKKRDEYSTFVRIESRGYSTCDTDSPRRVERGLYTSFID